MPYIFHIRDKGRSSSIMTLISLDNLWKSVQLNPHFRTCLSSESCIGMKKKWIRAVILSVVLINYMLGNCCLNFRYVGKSLAVSQLWIRLLLIELASS